jgi:hypothetical protein
MSGTASLFVLAGVLLVILVMVLLHLWQRAWLEQENARHHMAIRATVAAHHLAIKRLLYGEAQPEAVLADYPAEHDLEPAARPVQPAPGDPGYYDLGEDGAGHAGRHRLRA